MDLHEIWHVAIRTRSVDRAKDFYGFVFDWTFQEWGDHYVLIDTGAHPGGGLAPVANPEPPGVTSYVLVADVEATLRRAGDIGGRVVTPRTEEPGVGAWAHLADPWGNELGLWQASAPPPAPRGSGRNGFCWLELNAPLLDPTADYYEKLFGWDFFYDPGRYATYAHTRFEGKSFGVGLVADEPAVRQISGVLVHVYADDLAATGALIAARGGQVVLGPTEIPEVGYCSEFLDPEGNRLAIFSEAPPP
jgi:hypothetical protein